MIIRRDNYGKVSVLKDGKYQCGVMDSAGEMVVPFGKYGWISGFDHGLARVKSIWGDAYIDFETGKTEKAKWGIIDESGNEVLPVIYDEIWNFLKKGRSSTKVILNGQEKYFDLNCRCLTEGGRIVSSKSYFYRDDDYGTHYGTYAGSYAQDVMGYSDEVIDDAFEGDPDAYWNID